MRLTASCGPCRPVLAVDLAAAPYARSVTRRWLLFLVALGGAWGAVYPLTTVGLHAGLSPEWLVALRAVGAAVLLVPFAAATGALRPLTARPAAVATAGVIQAAVPLWLLTTAQQHVSAGVAGILSSLQPVFTAVLVALGGRVGWPVWAGVGLGATGAALLAGPTGRGTDPAAAIGVIGAAALFAAGAVFIGRVLPDVPPAGIAAAAMSLTAVVLLPTAAAVSPHPQFISSGLGAAAGLAVLTAGPLALFYRLIQDVGAERAALAWYLAPAAALVYDIPLVGLPSPAEIAGLLLVIAALTVAGR